MAQGQARTFHDKFKFLVEVDGFISAGFNKCSELSAELAKIEYYEGGALIPNKSPGRATYADITLERGATNDDDDMYTWFEEVIDAAVQAAPHAGAGAGSGQKNPDFKRNLAVIQLDRDGAELHRWNVFGAWPTKFVAGEWDNDADEKTIEMVTLTIDYFKKVKPS